jgi:hypothetical protein
MPLGLRNPLKLRDYPYGSVSSTWNPSDKGATVALSNGDLTAANAGGGSYQSIRGVRGNSAGKRYFEYTTTFVNGAAARFIAGIADSGFALSTRHLGENNAGAKKSAGYYSATGVLFRNLTNAASSGAGTTYVTSDVIGVEVDFATFTIKFYFASTGVLRHTYVDATPWPTLYPAVSLIAGGSCTLNCLGPFVYTPPGVIAWDAP